MTVSGFTFVRNAVTYDYPFVESLSSLLPLCDEVVVVVGRSQDDTLERVRSLRSPKIKIVESEWDDTVRSGGSVLAQQTNLALNHISGDWGIYLQADEVLHERDAPAIRNAMEVHGDNRRVEGLLLSYLHFYGSYDYVGAARRWYRREIRVIRNGIGVRSWGDAQGFRIDGRKMRVKLTDATVHHYGWVRSPEAQQRKQKWFHRLWHDDTWVDRHVGTAKTYDYSGGGRLLPFRGTHPAVMKDRIARQDWSFSYDPLKARVSLKERLLETIERRTGHRVGEYKNYIVI